MEKNTNKTAILLIVLAFLVIVGVVASRTTPEQTQRVEQEAAVVNVTEERVQTSYNTFIYQQFMSECVSDGLYGYCDCSFNYMIDKWGVESILEGGDTYLETGDITPEMMEAAEACSVHIQIN
jgi:hypothetical protein